jgi:hypothetical protein
MKKFATFVVLAVLTLGLSVQASTRNKTGNKYPGVNRESQKAQKREAKAIKRYAKAQKKSEHKMLKTEKKNSFKYKTKRS